MKRRSGDTSAAKVASLKVPKATKVTVRRSAAAGTNQVREAAGSLSAKTYYVILEAKSGRRKLVRRRNSREIPEGVRAVEARLRDGEQRLRRIARALAEVLERAGQGLEASPEVARSVQASENRWRTIAREYRLLDSRAVATLLGGSGPNRNKAHQLAKEGKIIGVKRGRGILYPGFEFDHGEVRPVIAEVAAIGRRNHWTDPHLLLWLASPNGYLEGRVPAQMMDDPDRILEAARQDMAERW